MRRPIHYWLTHLPYRSPQATEVLRLEGAVMKLSQALCSSILIDGLYPQPVEQHAGGGHLRVDLEGDEIVVRKPGTTLLLAYSKSAEQPRLVLTRSWVKPTTASPSIGEFRDQAFQAAVSKARELGWIA